MGTFKNALFSILLVVGLFACKTQKPAVEPQVDSVSKNELQSIRVNGEKLHYMEQGTGEPLIFIHGTIGDYRAWTSRMQPYSKDYRVISYSRRYAWPNEQKYDSLLDYSVRIHADDLHNLIRELGLEKVHLVGHSYGAYTALTMAIDHPEMVQSLILGEPPAVSFLKNSEKGQENFDDFMENNLRPAANAFRRDMKEDGLEYFIQGVNGPDFRLSQVPPSWKQGWLDNLLELWGFAINESFLNLDPSDINSLEVPVLLLIGDSSPTFLVEISKELHKLLPNSEMVGIENSSHGLFFENPEAVDKAMMAFLIRN